MDFPAITTTAPLPTGVRHWRAMVSPALANDASLARPWMKDGDRPFWFSRGSWALRALADAVASTTDAPPCLWLPDYFCNQATLPLRQIGARLIFYPVDEALQPAWGDCEALLAEGRPDLFVLVHYFGFPVATAAARRFCDRAGARLIEDAAHVLAPTEAIGNAGDFVIYSQYKHLPAPDGGLLLVRPSAARFLPAVQAAAHALCRAAPNATAWTIKRLLQTAAPALAARFAAARALCFDDDPAALPLAVTAALSPTARRLIAVLGAELDRVTSRRQANEAALRAMFAGSGVLEPLFAPPAGGPAPYRAVFRAIDHAAAQDIFQRIRRAGHVVETWPDMPPEVRAAPARHAAAIALRRTVLSLPIHADLSPERLTAAYGAAR